MDNFEFDSTDLSYLLREDNLDMDNEAILNMPIFPDDYLPPKA